MSDTHSKPFNIETQNPAEDCGLPDPVRPEGEAGLMVIERCVHGTRFLLVQQFDGSNVWMDAEKYWAESDMHYSTQGWNY